jgi:hypothetical protein
MAFGRSVLFTVSINLYRCDVLQSDKLNPVFSRSGELRKLQKETIKRERDV